MTPEGRRSTTAKRKPANHTRRRRQPPVRSTPEPRTPEELEPLGEDAYHGLAGEIVREIEPHSEADPAAILAQFLAAFGNDVGRGPGFRVEASRHHCNLFIGIVGETATARKGSSFGQALHLIKQADPAWAKRIASGASSGEGLIWEVRDPREAKGNQDADPGADDKRLLMVETELASPLERMAVPGNTLSPVLRQAWDGGKLDTLVKTNRATATNAHLSVIGHITAEELQRKLTATEQANGFANRFIWIFAKRSKMLPRGGNIEGVNWTPHLKRLRSALDASDRGDMGLTERAWRLWDEVYEDLSTVPSGMLGAATARAAAQVRRLAIIYALLDRKPRVSPDHLRAALAVWRYSADSAALLFGNALGDPTADALLSLLRANPDGMRLKAIHDAFARHRSAEEISRALDALSERDLVRQTRESTGGRPATRWRAVENLREQAATRPKRSKRAKKVKRGAAK
jgi:hypothetical protein